MLFIDAKSNVMVIVVSVDTISTNLRNMQMQIKQLERDIKSFVPSKEGNDMFKDVMGISFCYLLMLNPMLW